MIENPAIAQATGRQQTAADPAGSRWVGASAGTGKTKVLTDRALSLLLAGAPPGRLLCLTFTKAAAAEMANRIAERLTGWVTRPEPELAEALARLTGKPPDKAMLRRARRLFATVLDAPGGLKIQTIHAFCQSLLGRFPLEAGIAPHATVLDDAGAAELQREARERLLTATRAGGVLGQALIVLTEQVQEETFAELLAAVTQERGRIRRLLERHGGIDGLIAATAAGLGLPAGAQRATLLQQACTLAAEIEGDLRRAATALMQGTVSDQKSGREILAFLDQAEARVSRFGDYCQAFLTQAGGVRARLITNGCAAAHPYALEILAAEADRLVQLQDRLAAAAILQSTSALLRLGDALLTEYEALKAQRVGLDYDDLILKTRDLLAQQGGSSWVLYKLDGGLDHILIDEAQDTNPEQWEVVAALAQEFFTGAGRSDRPRTVFVVGDEKQSIFSFQRADPAAFDRMRAHFAERVNAAEQDWREVALDVSFRSTAAVLGAVDAVFAQDVARNGVGAAEIRHEVSRIGQAGLVELWPAVEPDDLPVDPDWALPLERRALSSPRARVAQLVARHIKYLTIADEGLLPARNRQMRPGDVLVLVRTRTAFVEELVRELKRLDVAVAGVDRMRLTEQLAVMDLMALGRFLLLPEDDFSLAAVLKSPLVGLDEEALFTLAWNRPGRLWRALRERAADPTFRAAAEFLGDCLARADFMPPFELFAHVLGPAGGRRRILERLGEEALDPIEEMLAQCLAYERDHVPSLEGFLYWLETVGPEVKRDSDVGDRDEVRIMTVHGAKGLQAPVVIMPDCLQMPTRLPRLLWPDGWGPLWSPRKPQDDAVSRSLRTAAEAARDQEYRRLLYVALTRAEDRLYVTGWQDRRQPSQNCWYKLIEAGIATVGEAARFDMAHLDLGIVGDGWRLSGQQTAEPWQDGRVAARAARTAALPAWAAAPAPAEPTPTRPLTPSRPEEEPPARSPLGPDDSHLYARGRLIHRLLQTLPDLAPAEREAAGRRFLGRQRHGLAPERAEQILRETLAVLDHPEFAPIWAPGSRAEVPLVGRLGGAVVSGQIDRLAVTDAAVLIIDFKTNRPPPHDLADVSPAYLRQLAVYRGLVRAIYPSRAVRAALLWTDVPFLMPVPDAALDGAMPAAHS